MDLCVGHGGKWLLVAVLFGFKVFKPWAALLNPMNMEKDQVLTSIVKNVPYPEQIKDIDTSLSNEVRFTWRGTRFAANVHGGLDQVGDGVLIGSDIAILMRNLVFPPVKPFR